MAGTEFTGGSNGVNVPGKFNFGMGNAGGGTGMIPWKPGTIRDPFQFSDRPMTPAEAQAMIANAVANPIAPVPFTIQGPRYRNGYHIDDIRIQDQQEQKPEDPGRRYVTASTWGRTIPISMGRRRLEGNILQSTALVPKLEGTTEYTIVYEIPIYEDPPLKPGGAITVTYPGDDRPRPDPSDPQAGCDPQASSPCDTRSGGSEGPGSTFEIELTLTDPNPGGPYTVSLSSSVIAGTGVDCSSSGDTTTSCVVTLTGNGPWTISYAITSTNDPPPTVELSFTAGGVSQSGLSNPHSGHINVNTDGVVTEVT